MILGIDLDGVCYDFAEDARVVCAEHLNVSVESLAPAAKWNFFHEWGFDNELFWKLFLEDMHRGRAWRQRPPYDGTVESLTHLRDQGDKIVIVTSRKGAEPATAEWVRTFDIPYDALVIGEDKTLARVDLLLDDWERNWREMTAHGTPCVLMDRLWNQHVVEAERVHDWDDFIEYVDGMRS